VTQWPAYRIVRGGVARTFQSIRLFASMTVWEHLIVAQPRRASMMRAILPVHWTERAMILRAEEVLRFFSLENYRAVIASTLPYGIQRKVEMARALTAEPKLLLLDELAAGMNHEEAQELRTLLLQLNARGLPAYTVLGRLPLHLPSWQ
jgi:branched-chain amino acid transport system ATP-binding protein